MNANNHKTGLVYILGALLLGIGVLVSTGFARNLIAAATGSPSPMAANAPALTESEVAPLLALDKATEAVAQRVTPSIVSITVTSKPSPDASQQMGPQGLPQGIDPNDFPPGIFGQFFGQQRRMQPQIERALGSGVIVSPDGYIVTNNHVVDSATNVQVELNDGRTFTAKVVGTDKDTDLAVVKVNATGLPSIGWGDSSLLKPGETVLAFGNPLGENFTVTRGIVSALNRQRDQGAAGADTRGEFIQTDAAINPGNSGGPLVNARGEVVGINTEMASSNGGYSGIGFAIPSNLVEPTAAALIKDGKVVRGYLGIEVTAVTPDLASALDLANTKGALIDSVNPDSPAAKAGLKHYDVVTAINGKNVADSSDLQDLVGAVAPGNPVRVTIMRSGQPMTVTATLGDLASAGDAADNSAASGGAPETPGKASSPGIGISFEALTPDARAQLHLPDSVNGLVVDKVEPGSPADNAGIAEGDVIEQVNQHPVATVDGLKQQVGSDTGGRPLLLMVHKSNGDFIIAVRPSESGQ